MKETERSRLGAESGDPDEWTDWLEEAIPLAGSGGLPGAGVTGSVVPPCELDRTEETDPLRGRPPDEEDNDRECEAPATPGATTGRLALLARAPAETEAPPAADGVGGVLPGGEVVGLVKRLKDMRREIRRLERVDRTVPPSTSTPRRDREERLSSS